MADVDLSTLGPAIKTAYEAESDTNALTDALLAEIGANTAKVSYTDSAAVAANTAKVTCNTANVTSAGALMDSEVTNLAQVKAFDSSDYDPAGTDNSTDVTLAGTPNYITIVGQVITRALINLTSHVTGILPVANGGTAASTASGARTALGVAIGSDVQAYDANNATTDDVDAAQAALVGVNTQTGTTYTLVIGDAGKVVEMNNAAANTLTVPPNSSVAFLTNTHIDLLQYGAGLTTIAAGAGVTIRSSGALLDLGGQYSGASLYKRGTDEWVLVGDLA